MENNGGHFFCKNHVHTWACTLRTIFRDSNNRPTFWPGRNFPESDEYARNYGFPDRGWDL